MTQPTARRRERPSIGALALWVLVGAGVLGACVADDEAATTSTTMATTTTSPTTSEVVTTTTAAPTTTTTEASSTTSESVSSTTSTSTTVAERVDDGILTIGQLLPSTGELAHLGPSQIAAVALAVQDVNAAGGVGGRPVIVLAEDSGGISTGLHQESTTALLDGGADVIIGASSSAISKEVIDRIVQAGVIQFSAANTSPWFTTAEDEGLYFRTAPSDLLQGKVLARLVAEDGNASTAIVFRDDAYGQGLAGAFADNFVQLGGEIPGGGFVPYNPELEDFSGLVEPLQALEPDAVVLIGFAESATILTLLDALDLGPTSGAAMVYGVDGNTPGMGAAVADPAILAGFQGTEPSVDLDAISEFIDRLQVMADEREIELAGNYIYGPEAYDAVVITALAAEIADTDNPPAIAAQINGVTREGAKCSTFVDCLTLIEAGEDIDYDGVGGPYEFVAEGEPSAASYRISVYDGDTTVNDDLSSYVFAN